MYIYIYIFIDTECRIHNQKENHAWLWSQGPAAFLPRTGRSEVPKRFRIPQCWQNKPFRVVIWGIELGGFHQELAWLQIASLDMILSVSFVAKYVQILWPMDFFFWTNMKTLAGRSFFVGSHFDAELLLKRTGPWLSIIDPSGIWARSSATLIPLFHYVPSFVEQLAWELSGRQGMPVNVLL